MLTDFHTHILPGIDDGAKDLEISLEMLNKLKQDGVTDVVLTPHFYFHEQSVEKFIKRRDRAFELLKGAAPSDIRLHIGAEAEFSDVTVNYEFLSGLGIDGGKYVMLEFPTSKNESEKRLLSRIDGFLYKTEMVPIIAHIERYPIIRSKPWLVSELTDMGCLVQVNSTSVLESKEGSLVDALLKTGHAHLLGSDCHDMKGRPPSYIEALELIRQRYGGECYEYMTQLAQSVMTQEQISVRSNSRIRKIFGKYR